MYDLANLDNFY